MQTLNLLIYRLEQLHLNDTMTEAEWNVFLEMTDVYCSIAKLVFNPQTHEVTVPPEAHETAKL